MKQVLNPQTPTPISDRQFSVKTKLSLSFVYLSNTTVYLDIRGFVLKLNEI